MSTPEIVNIWFTIWKNGNFEDLPLAKNFKHTSPYGTIEGKQAYLNLVTANKDKFLGHYFKIHNEVYEGNKGSIRYTAIQNDFRLEVTEWHFVKDGLIQEIIAYYNIPGEIRGDRKLKDLE